MSMLVPGQPFTMGSMLLNTEQPFQFGYDDWKCHMAVLGGTGGGKSKFLELFCSYLLYHNQGGILIDPHGDLANNLMAFVAFRRMKGDDLWKRVHYLEVSPWSGFSFDPFATLPRRSQVSRLEYESLLAAKVDRVARNMLRRVAEADLDTMNRLKRWLKNMLFACGTSIDDENTHLGIDHALIFTNPQHDDFPDLYKAVEPFLPDEVRGDFKTLIGTPRAFDREKWVESTINRLRDVLSPLTKMVFGQHAPSINVRQIVRDRGFIIANLAESPHLSFDQKVTLGGLLIDEVFTAKIAEENVPEEQRVPFTMMIDESGEFLGEDLQRGLGAVRKYKLSMVLAAQDLSTFAKGELDIAPKVLSMCGTVVTFRQNYRKDKEVLADRLGTENIDFTPHLTEHQLQREPTWEQVVDYSIGVKQDKSASVGEGLTDSETDTVQKGTAHGEQTGAMTSDGKNVVVSGSQTLYRPGKEGAVKGSDGRSVGAQHSDAKSRSITDTAATTVGKAIAKSRSSNRSFSESEGQSLTLSYKWVNLPNLVSVWEKNGLEAGPVQEQYEKMMQQLHALGTAEAVVSTLSSHGGFPVKIALVPELWHWRAKWAAVNCIKREVTKLHAYNFCPEKAAELVLPAKEEPPGLVDGAPQFGAD